MEPGGVGGGSAWGKAVLRTIKNFQTRQPNAMKPFSPQVPPSTARIQTNSPTKAQWPTSALHTAARNSLKQRSLDGKERSYHTCQLRCYIRFCTSGAPKWNIKKKRKRRNEKEEKEMKRKKRQRGRRTHDLHLDTGMPSGTVPTMPSANTIGDTGLTL